MVVSNEKSLFRILALPPGVYSVQISHIGYEPVTVEKVPIRLGKTISFATRFGLNIGTSILWQADPPYLSWETIPGT